MADHECVNRILIGIVLLTFTFGCMSTRSLTNTSPKVLANSINVEDVVEIERIDGTSLKFEVTEMSKEGMHGPGIFVPYPDIQTIAVTRESIIRTGLLVVLGIAIVTALEKHSDCGIFKWDAVCDDLN